MSKKISAMLEKQTLVDADFLTIVDSEDGSPATQNKKVQRTNTGFQDAAPPRNSLGNDGAWTDAGNSATRDVGDQPENVAAGDAPAAAVTGHESTFAHANLPTTNQKAAMDVATNPSGANAFITRADIVTGPQPAAPAGPNNYLGNDGGWVVAGNSATRNVGTGLGDVAAGDAPAAAVTAHDDDLSAHDNNLPTTDQKAAMTAANAPAAGNAFATIADLSASSLTRSRQVLGNQASTVTWDWNNGASGFTVTLTGNANVGAPLNPPVLSAGQYRDGLITITQDATGGRVPTWNAAWKNAPTLADGQIAANAVVDMAVIYDGTDYVLGEPVTRA